MSRHRPRTLEMRKRRDYDPLETATRTELRAMVRGLELANYVAERRADELAEELAASRARERDLLRRLRAASETAATE